MPTHRFLLQVLSRQVRKDRLVYVILAECRSYFPRPRLRSQTTMSIGRPPSVGDVYHPPTLPA